MLCSKASFFLFGLVLWIHVDPPNQTTPSKTNQLIFISISRKRIWSPEQKEKRAQQERTRRAKTDSDLGHIFNKLDEPRNNHFMNKVLSDIHLCGQLIGMSHSEFVELHTRLEPVFNTRDENRVYSTAKPMKVQDQCHRRILT